MAESPSVNKDRVLSCSVYVNGGKLKDTYSLVSASVRLELNRIGKATLKFNAGDMDKQTFDESDDMLFKPGNSIHLDAGGVDKAETLFDGIIVGLRILTGNDSRSYMVVECRDNAYAATQGRKNRIFEKKKDDDIIKEVLAAYGSVDVDTTPYQHPTLVQYYCSDWDFALSRADACGLFVFTEGNKIKVKKPDVNASPVLTVTYGTDISDLAGLTYDPDDAAHKNGVLLPVETGKGRYGTVVTARAGEIDGMSCVSAAEQRISLRPQDEQNYIIFYYETKQYTVEYSVWPFGGGTVSRTIEVVSGTTELVGSTAAAEPGYSFQGWYLDEACTVPAPESMAAVTGASILPKRDGLLTNPNKNVFYAKFMPAFGDLTITRANGTDDEGAGTQVFVYRITAADDADMVTYVTVTGNGSAVIRGLPCRRYIVEQAADWSWRYADAAQTVEVTEDGASAVFDGDAVRDQWLSGSSDAVCNRKG